MVLSRALFSVFVAHFFQFLKLKKKKKKNDETVATSLYQDNFYLFSYFSHPHKQRI